jgi:RHS repeat-associated protein
VLLSVKPRSLSALGHFAGDPPRRSQTQTSARTYDPNIGGFTTVDPLEGVPGSTTVANPYHYANNDPLNQVDPLELRPVNDSDLRMAPSEAGSSTNQGAPRWRSMDGHPYPRLPAVDYAGSQAQSALFRFGARQGYGTLEIGLFISECLVLGVGEGDCRGPSRFAGPTNFETGSGFLRVNPSCIDVGGRHCLDAYEIGGDFLGSPGLRRRNRLEVDDRSSLLSIDVGLVNSAAAALAGEAARLFPSITAGIHVGFLDGRELSLAVTGDPYPSVEVYQRRRDGTLEVFPLRPEADLGWPLNPDPAICLDPLGRRLC